MILKRFTSALTLFAFSGILTSFAQAQIIPLTIDSAQSSVEISLNGDVRSSQLSGGMTFDIQSSDPPSGSAQITDLSLVVDEEIEFSFFFGSVTASAAPGDVTISMVTPGAAGTISGNAFSQLANLLALGGAIEVSDRFGLAGGDQTFDLSEIVPGPVDFDSLNVTQSRGVITISGSITITEMVDLGFGDVPLVVDMTYVASGIVPDNFLLGDVNLDSTVDFLDIAPFIAILSGGGFQDEADIDRNTVVNFLDIAPFIAILSGQ